MTAISTCFWPMAIPTTRSSTASPGGHLRRAAAAFPQHGKGISERQRAERARFSKPLAARGLAIGDFDNDGAVDVLIAINNGAPLVTA